MRKYGLIAAIVGFGILGVDLVLRLLVHVKSWLWLPGFLAMAAGSAALLWSRGSGLAPGIPAPKGARIPRKDTARLLDAFEQRFTELKARGPSAALLGELYALGSQMEMRGCATQATAVYRHMARIDNSYRDVSARLQRLMDGDGAKRVRNPASTVPYPAAPVRSPDSPALRPPATDAGANVQAPERLGRYQLEREIGRGAMGVVYLGRDTTLNRLVAIKAIALASEFSDAELIEARSRFFREAEAAGRLNHPNIVTIYDIGEERGLAYIAMEYLKGRHLSDYTTLSTLLEPRKVLEVIARTADALGFAHKQQVVHRDIKPANLMYDTSTDVLKITDFGIARLSDGGSTRTGIVLGTPSFMSPEQLEGRAVTGHSDLFSLGVSLFQLLTGQLPFKSDSMTGLMQQIAEAPHPPLRAFRPDLPICIESVIDRALAKNPDARFDTGAQMAAALNDCRSHMASGLP